MGASSDPTAGKPANGDGRPEPEQVERRGGAEENTGQASTRRTPSRASVSPEYAATGETRRALVREPRLMTDWSSFLAGANPLRKG